MEGKLSCRCLRRKNRTQLLLCRPPHPAERDSICCCSWPLTLMTLRKKKRWWWWSLTNFYKEKKKRKKSKCPPFIRKREKEGKVKRMLHHFLVRRFSVMGFGSKVCYQGECCECQCFVWLPQDSGVYENTARGRDLSWDLHTNTVPTRAIFFLLLTSVKSLSLSAIWSFTFPLALLF